MKRVRVIPVLLLSNNGLVKTTKFGKEVYLGDPINTIKLFNDKEVDEIVVLDISPDRNVKGPKLDLVRELGGEAFMPLAYGGGISTLHQIEQILKNGAEKVVLNSNIVSNPTLVKDAVRQFGSQSIVASIDIKKNLFGSIHAYTHNGKKKINHSIKSYLHLLEEYQVGEILVQNIDRDGLMNGYDLPMIQEITANVHVPVIICGGAGSLHDFYQAVEEGGASAVAAGSMFVFTGKHKAVLITYPSQQQLKETIFSKLKINALK